MTATSVGPANLIELRCTATRDFRRGGKAQRQVECRGVLKEIPRAWRVQLVPLATRAQATGEAEVKKCDRCGQWWELRTVA